jgi:hypothetical protein
MTRTTGLRMQLSNPKLTLRPGMFATATIAAQLAPPSLVVPREAVLDTGTRQVVFVALDGGHFEPRSVKTGAAGDDGSVQVLSGLAPGEMAVTSGQFLMDAESRMKEAIQKHLSDKLLAKTHGVGSANHGNKHAPEPAATSPTTAATAPWHQQVDQTVLAYLSIASTLGAAQKQDAPVDVTALVQTAAALRDQSQPHRILAKNVVDTTQAMDKRPLARQREAFTQVSDAVVALVEASPPSEKVADKLQVYYCPMAKGQWLQASAPPANPYYSTEMKQCAELRQTIQIKH